MHVAFVAPETVHHGGTDAAVRIDRIAGLLASRGHDVTVACTPWWENPEEVREFEAEDRRITYRGLTTGGIGRRFALKLPMTLRKIDADVIHADATFPGAVVAADGGTRLSRTPLVVEWYDAVPDDRLSRRAARTGAEVIVPSRLVRRRLREAGADGDDVTVIPDPIDVDLVESVDPDEEFEDHVVYSRRLDEAANLETLLLGLAEFREYDWSATVIGDGPRRGEYERQAADLRIDDRVGFVGECPLEERVGIYRAAHVFVQTAKECVFPTELLWAMCAGCVGVVEYHAESSAHELVEGRDRGFRITSPEELADVIPEAGDLERRSFDGGFEEYDRREVIEQYLQVYRDAIGDERL